MSQGIVHKKVRETGVTEKDYEVIIPQGRIGSSDEVANTALWLCSDQSSYIISIDGGLTAKG
ncbi:SDR family oxidoreductase [Bacillus sp. JCM 19041]|uniref:SDR family oxidoreductase n=1 Tax=Bacillus sp. JCM 19041 TaxID=1460637 RepID=UPI0006D1B1B8